MDSHRQVVKALGLGGTSHINSLTTRLNPSWDRSVEFITE